MRVLVVVPCCAVLCAVLSVAQIDLSVQPSKREEMLAGSDHNTKLPQLHVNGQVCLLGVCVCVCLVGGGVVWWDMAGLQEQDIKQPGGLVCMCVQTSEPGKFCKGSMHNLSCFSIHNNSSIRFLRL